MRGDFPINSCIIYTLITEQFSPSMASSEDIRSVDVREMKQTVAAA
jgi:hypothetical protein